MSKAIESRTQAYKRITDGIRSFVNHSVGATALILEAKRLEIWKEKWSSWQEYCEKEFGKSRHRAYQLLEVASTVEEISSVDPVNTEDGTSLGILHEMTFRQAKELKGLPPEQKAEVFHKAVAVSAGKSPKPQTIAKVRQERDDIDPADKISASTRSDVAIAREASDLYPKTVTFELHSREEEDSFVKWSQEIGAQRGHKNGHVKIDMHEAIRSVCQAYKKTTGKTLSVKPLDAGQLRRLLESGITLEEFLEVGEKAWKSDGFLAHYSHQIAMFVKHYGNIRNEISENLQGHHVNGPQKHGSVPNHAAGF